MNRKLAIKRLTRSDLTIFDFHYRTIGAGNQKSINLNANVFIDKLYPLLREICIEKDTNKFTLDLSILGPGIEAAYVLPQKIIKTAKNWRLNGKLIQNPDESTERFDILQEGDYAVLEFTGLVQPDKLRMALIAKALDTDSALHIEMSTFLANKSMAVINTGELRNLIESCSPSIIERHSIKDFIDTGLLENAALGSEKDKAILRRKRGSRGVTQDELKSAIKNAEATGRLGEELVNLYLEELKENETIENYKWDADENAISPYDFSIITDGSISTYIDVKSTVGDFSNPVHISLGEMKQIAYGDSPYDIYRVYDTKYTGAKFRIARNLKDFALDILSQASHLPEGVSVDSFSINVSNLPFENEIAITTTNEQETTE